MLARHAVPLTSSISLRLIQPFSCTQITRETPRIPVFVFKRLRTPSFSVSCKSFACQSYENSRVYTNNSHSGTRHLPLITLHCIQVLSFHTLANSFALTKNTTLFFSSDSELFAQNNRGWGTPFWYHPAPRPPGTGPSGQIFTSLLPYLVPSLLPCFLTSLQYNRCASIRGENEFQPATRRDTYRLRAAFLGRQHHGNLRAPLLLRR